MPHTVCCAHEMGMRIFPHTSVEPLENKPGPHRVALQAKRSNVILLNYIIPCVAVKLDTYSAFHTPQGTFVSRRSSNDFKISDENVKCNYIKPRK